ncbi:uncharacterized protein LOC143849095 isoform X2 [Tasmannia lanceolata]|uniref:uncharacterized protein LOC143849095 isoform X2 n=1 Tax=Tasmannia lanceolata TaxID=3420 RepID=UPI00406285BA
MGDIGKENMGMLQASLTSGGLLPCLVVLVGNSIKWEPWSMCGDAFNNMGGAYNSNVTHWQQRGVPSQPSGHIQLNFHSNQGIVGHQMPSTLLYRPGPTSANCSGIPSSFQEGFVGANTSVSMLPLQQENTCPNYNNGPIFPTQQGATSANWSSLSTSLDRLPPASFPDRLSERMDLPTNPYLNGMYALIRTSSDAFNRMCRGAFNRMSGGYSLNVTPWQQTRVSSEPPPAHIQLNNQGIVLGHQIPSTPLLPTSTNLSWKPADSFQQGLVEPNTSVSMRPLQQENTCPNYYNGAIFQSNKGPPRRTGPAYQLPLDRD